MPTTTVANPDRPGPAPERVQTIPLRGVKLIVCRVIHIDEIHVVLAPVIVSMQQMIARIIVKALSAERGSSSQSANCVINSSRVFGAMVS